MKRLFFVLILVMSVLSSEAQNKSKKFNCDDIKNNPEYFWGMSPVLDSQDDAFERSVVDLYDNIAIHCNPDVIYLSGIEQKEYLLDIIKTFENKVKEKMTQIPLVEDFDDDEYSYFVYIKRSDFMSMCDDRTKTIERLASKGYGVENDETMLLEDALRSYCWGLRLCLAHPYGKSLKINIDGDNVSAYEWFLEHIDGQDGVLGSFAFIVPKQNAIEETGDGTIVNVNVRSAYGVPVSNLKFDYYNGQRYIPTSVNDGKAVMLLKSIDRPVINIRIDCFFENESTIEPEVHEVLNKMDCNIKFKNVKHTINVEKLRHNVKQDKDNIKEFNEAIESEWKKIDKQFDVNDADYNAIMRDVEKALRSENYQSVRHHFTDEGFGMLDTLSKYGKMMVVGDQDYKFIKFGDQVICRDINMRFDFRNNVTFSRDVVLRFDAESKKIVSLAFRLSSVTEKDIVTKTKWPEDARLMLVNFLEDYQTAYALKRHEYLESIYSDDALIIVGHVVKKTVIPDRAEFDVSENDVRLMQYDKSTYLNNLNRVFKSQEYINIRFADTEFTRASTSSKREVYGVRLLQEYYSATYGDKGYLFLLVDLTDEKPLIHVRAWQPDEVELDKLMGMKDLRI